jgi:RNA polymerase sigma factor (sigma-70 family)
MTKQPQREESIRSGELRSPAMLDSVELVQRAQAGDMQALQDLFARYYERIRCVVRMNMGPRAKSYAESMDIVQETFIVAVGAFDRFEMRDELSFLNWLARLAQHKITDLVAYHHAQKRDRQREQAMEVISSARASGVLRIEPVALGSLPEAHAEAQDELDLLLDCAQELSEEQRRAFELRNFIVGEPDWTTIAELLGKSSPGAARMACSRASMALLKILDKRRQG